MNLTPFGPVLLLSFVVGGLLAYLLGSIPTGYLVARARGIDIRRVGSGNIGATNVFRAVGRTAGLLVLGIDYLKGWVACGCVPLLVTRGLGLGVDEMGMTGEPLALVAGICAVLGHNYTCWLRFKGGKGIATSAGVLTALVPLPLLIAVAVWILVFALWRYVSLASVTGAALLPVAVWVTGGSYTLIVTTAVLAGLAIYRHRSNIQRLRAGTEPRVEWRKRKPA